MLKERPRPIGELLPVIIVPIDDGTSAGLFKPVPFDTDTIRFEIPAASSMAASFVAIFSVVCWAMATRLDGAVRVGMAGGLLTTVSGGGSNRSALTVARKAAE